MLQLHDIHIQTNMDEWRVIANRAHRIIRLDQHRWDMACQPEDYSGFAATDWPLESYELAQPNTPRCHDCYTSTRT